jgi:hypothetical protein
MTLGNTANLMFILYPPASPCSRQNAENDKNFPGTSVQRAAVNISPVFSPLIPGRYRLQQLCEMPPVRHLLMSPPLAYR